MRIDIEDFRKHYASLSDAALLELNRSELVDAAQKCYDEELARRDLHSGSKTRLPGVVRDREDDRAEEEPEVDWLEEATCVCSFASFPGDDSAKKIEDARGALQRAGIPCHAATRRIEPTPTPSGTRLEYELMVPSRFTLEAMSVLDQEIFNAEIEADWRVHFEALSDKDLQAADPQALVAGLLDRVDRLTRSYQQELERRGLE